MGPAGADDGNQADQPHDRGTQHTRFRADEHDERHETDRGEDDLYPSARAQGTGQHQHPAGDDRQIRPGDSGQVRETGGEELGAGGGILPTDIADDHARHQVRGAVGKVGRSIPQSVAQMSCHRGDAVGPVGGLRCGDRRQRHRGNAGTVGRPDRRRDRQFRPRLEVEDRVERVGSGRGVARNFGRGIGRGDEQRHRAQVRDIDRCQQTSSGEPLRCAGQFEDPTEPAGGPGEPRVPVCPVDQPGRPCRPHRGAQSGQHPGAQHSSPGAGESGSVVTSTSPPSRHDNHTTDQDRHAGEQRWPRRSRDHGESDRQPDCESDRDEPQVRATPAAQHGGTVRIPVRDAPGASGARGRREVRIRVETVGPLGLPRLLALLGRLGRLRQIRH